MDRKTQDLAWSCLPREFREEVKKEYRKGYVCETLAMLITLFGHHNLTSDAEGEEMLWVSRKEIQQLVAANDVVILGAAGIDNIETIQAKTVSTILNRLFGSKCLPDETKKGTKDDTKEPNIDISEPNVDSLHGNVDSPEQKAAGPKYGSDDKVTLNGYGGFVITSSYLDPYTREYKYRLGGFKGHFCESDLEPYTEPKEDHIGENHEMVKDFDTILKDSFAKERRLNIASTIIEHIIKSGYYSLSEKYREDNIKEMVKVSLQITDAIMTECEKGGVK